jgi:sulfate/thiosulfate-binding protein
MPWFRAGEKILIFNYLFNRWSYISNGMPITLHSKLTFVARPLRHAASALFVAALTALAASRGEAAAPVTLLNVSYDVTREFYREYNPVFEAHWKALGGGAVTVNQSHGGSSKQARAVIDGLEADVVTMNQSTDIDAIAEQKLLSPDWAQKFPDNAAPFTTTIFFLVRKGNPKGIKDWSDLVRPGVQVIIPNPKTSGNGRYSYLAAWGYALQTGDHDKTKAREFVKALFANVPVLDTGGRGATTTFAQRGIGDVLLTFENEVQLAISELGADKFEVVVPSVSVLAEVPVAVVDSVVDRRGTRKVAEEYLRYHFSDEGQELAAKHHFRPRSTSVLQKHQAEFPALKLLTIEEIAGSWKLALEVHFADGGVFDQITTRK